jgi:hypothetical protein
MDIVWKLANKFSTRLIRREYRRNLHQIKVILSPKLVMVCGAQWKQ